jgi:hypothetical protein
MVAQRRKKTENNNKKKEQKRESCIYISHTLKYRHSQVVVMKNGVIFFG